MMIALGIAGTLIGLVAAIVAIGMALPKDHVATRRAPMPAAPGPVWSTITDHAAEPSWRRGVKSVERAPDRDGHAVWKEVDGHGQAMLLETMESHPPHRLVRHIVPTGLPFGGSWTIEVAPDGDGSLVTVTEKGEVTNPMFRFMSRFVFGHTATIDAYLRALGRRFGADVVIS